MVYRIKEDKDKDALSQLYVHVVDYSCGMAEARNYVARVIVSHSKL